MKVKIVEPMMENRNQICPFDFCHLYKMKTVRVYDNRTTKTVKIYSCPVCHKKYIHEKRFPDMQIIGIGGQDYFNLNLPKEQIRVKLSQTHKNKTTKPISEQASSITSKTSLDKEKIQEPKSAPKATIKKLPVVKGVSTPLAKEATSTITKAAPEVASFSTPNLVSKTYPHMITKETAEGYVVFTKMTLVERCVHPNCYSPLDKIEIEFRNKKGKTVRSVAKKCAACNQYYVPISTYNANRDIMKCLNVKAVLEYESKSRKQREPDHKANEQVKNKYLVIKPIVEPENFDNEKKIRPLTQAQKQAEKEFEKIRKEAQKGHGAGNSTEILIKDFVIKRNSFRCVHNEHVLKDISASITIINQKGNFETMKVPAGYCKECNVYFIFEDVYKQIQNRGTPICRLYDWKAIESGAHAGNMMLAKESLLKQYGYNVNSNEGLSSDRRKRILQILVDNHIMTKSEIISYLKFFISQRKNNSSMKMAVAKWNSDKEFIENYKMGSLKNYYIGSLKR